MKKAYAENPITTGSSRSVDLLFENFIQPEVIAFNTSTV
jgi:hypothetical protein